MKKLFNKIKLKFTYEYWYYRYRLCRDRRRKGLYRLRAKESLKEYASLN